MSLKTDFEVIALRRDLEELKNRVHQLENAAGASLRVSPMTETVGEKEIRHIGRGKYAVYSNGERLTDLPLSKDDALRAAAE